jgi:putative ABC transport system ATP-binding protein
MKVQPVAEQAKTITPLIALSAVQKTYRTGKLEYPAIRGIDLSIEPGEMVSIVGPSASGKSTILNLLTGIDRPTAGEVYVDGQRIDLLTEEQLATWRGRRVGIVFQFFQLLPTLTALENAVLPMDFARLWHGKERLERAARHLEMVGLGDKLDHLPSELSGGEQQRVAIARALVTEPTILLADEPTGNLDTRTSIEVMDIFQRLNIERGITILLITHEHDIAEYGTRLVRFRDGRIQIDQQIANRRDAQKEIAALPPPEPEDDAPSTPSDHVAAEHGGAV